MKKITLFLAAMAAAGAANAVELDPNTVDPSDNTTPVKYNSVSGEFENPEIDETFTFAIKVDLTDTETAKWANGSTEDIINTFAFKTWYKGGEDRNLITRLDKIADGIYGIDINFSQLKFKDGGSWGKPTDPEEYGQSYFIAWDAQIGGTVWWTNLSDQRTIKFIMDETKGGAPTVIVDADWLETHVSHTDGEKQDAIAGLNAPGTNVTGGVADVYADENNTEIAGYYTLLGAQLAEEPANGVFIVKFTNGKAIKVVK